MFTVSEEIAVQREALQIISHNDNSLVLAIVKYQDCLIPSIFRTIITEFENREFRVPTIAELISNANDKLNLNLYEFCA